jgi:hypothetical protein
MLDWIQRGDEAMQCPSCAAKVKEDAKLCVKCGKNLAEAREAEAREAEAHKAAEPAKPKPLDNLKYLKELVPKKAQVTELLPHPTGWVLGIGGSAVALVALIHLAVLPSRAEAEAATIDLPVTLEQKTEFQVCLATSRAKAENSCGQITGTAQGLRRVSCQVASRAAGYTQCTGAMVGRLGSCLKRCGQAARTCSSTCAIVGGKSWLETAQCLLPCWKSRLDACVTTCF